MPMRNTKPTATNWTKGRPGGDGTGGGVHSGPAARGDFRGRGTPGVAGGSGGSGGSGSGGPSVSSPITPPVSGGPGKPTNWKPQTPKPPTNGPGTPTNWKPQSPTGPGTPTNRKPSPPTTPTKPRTAAPGAVGGGSVAGGPPKVSGGPANPFRAAMVRARAK